MKKPFLPCCFSKNILMMNDDAKKFKMMMMITKCRQQIYLYNNELISSFYVDA